MYASLLGPPLVKEFERVIRVHDNLAPVLLDGFTDDVVLVELGLLMGAVKQFTDSVKAVHVAFRCCLRRQNCVAVAGRYRSNAWNSSLIVSEERERPSSKPLSMILIGFDLNLPGLRKMSLCKNNLLTTAVRLPSSPQVH